MDQEVIPFDFPSMIKARWKADVIQAMVARIAREKAVFTGRDIDLSILDLEEEDLPIRPDLQYIDGPRHVLLKMNCLTPQGKSGFVPIEFLREGQITSIPRVCSGCHYDMSGTTGCVINQEVVKALKTHHEP